MSDLAIQFTFDYANRDRTNVRLYVEVIRFTQISDSAGSTVLSWFIKSTHCN